MKKAECIAKYGEEAWEARKEYRKQYYQAHRKESIEQSKQYYQSHKEEKNEYGKRYYQENKEKWKDYVKGYVNKQYYQENKEKIIEYRKNYYATPYGRAYSLCSAYQRIDKQYNRGDCTLTVDYIVDNIFNNTCLYCGENDWRKLGCDRVDNSKPHTPDNVVCCCWDCNNKRRREGFEKFLYKSWRKRFNS